MKKRSTNSHIKIAYFFLKGVHSNRQNLIRDDLKITCCWLSANLTLLAGVLAILEDVSPFSKVSEKKNIRHHKDFMTINAEEIHNGTLQQNFSKRLFR